MSVFLKKDFPVKWIRVGDLSVVWAESQRGLNERHVQRLMDEFDPNAFGVIAVTLPNGSGHHHVVDGQHRVESVRRLRGNSEMVPCVVIDAKTPAMAAESYLKMNIDRKRPHPVNTFRVAVTAGRQMQVEINDLLTDLGYTISAGSEDGHFSAVGAAEAIYQKHGIDVLKNVLLVLQGTWGMVRDSVHNSIVRGYATLIGEHAPDLERDRLVDKVGKKYTPARLLGAARQARDFLNCTVAEAVMVVLIQTYNHGLRDPARKIEDPRP